MADHARKINLRHRGRISQIPIYLGKLLRGFVYMSDWKMLPMAAVIAALACLVVRRGFFVTMDGTLKGNFAFCCVAIWNGCFNSIQVICRERPIIKREHRSGMHISSYVISHMLYQALLCAGQTAVTLYVSAKCGVQFPAEGFITGAFVVDLGITLFLITFASDMLSLLISAIAHSTTAAMTVMPFILIFQLVFSGGMFNLPVWAERITNFTISNPGLKCLNAQANYNELPMVSAWNALIRMEDDMVQGSFTLGELMDLAGQDTGVIKTIRSSVINTDEIVNALEVPETETPEAATTESVEASATEAEALTAEAAEATEAETEAPTAEAAEATGAETEAQIAEAAEATEAETQASTAEATEEIAEENQALTAEAPAEEVQPTAEATEAPGTVLTVGNVIDFITNTDVAKMYRNVVVPYSFKVSDVIDTIGREQLKTTVQTRTAAAMADPHYDHNKDNILNYWFSLGIFSLAYALLAIILLEFIDKDKR